MAKHGSDYNALKLIELGDRLFAEKRQYDELWQTLAEEFYPEMADFTYERVEGDEYAKDMFTSVPAQDRRDLAGALGAILRPRGKPWFRPRPKDEWRRTPKAMEAADFIRDQMRDMLYSQRSLFQRTMDMADNDFVTFGNSVPVLTENPDRNGFIFEHTHLRDSAFTHNRYLEVDVNHRKFKRTLRQIAQRWGEDALSEPQKELMKTNPYHQVELRHICMPAEDFDPYMKRNRKHPFVSVYVNVEAKKTIEEGGYFEFPYLHRRWKVPFQSPYGYSPAAMLGLIDARVLQTQERIILDSGELAIAPPLLARRDAVLGGINNFAGAITFLDMEYDERFGDAIKPLDVGGDVRLGLEMKMDTREIIKMCWYLNKLNLPSDKDMTAFEVNERIAEYIRSAGPIFEPFEADNANILDRMLEMSLRLGWIPYEIFPPELRGGEIEWEFDTPIQQAYARQTVARARETVEYSLAQAQLDPKVIQNLNTDALYRDGVQNILGEADWLKPMEAVLEQRQADAEQMKKMEAMQEAQASAEVASKAAEAPQKLGGLDKLMPMMQQLTQGQQQPKGPYASMGDIDEEVDELGGDADFGSLLDEVDLDEGLGDDEDINIDGETFAEA